MEALSWNPGSRGGSTLPGSDFFSCDMLNIMRTVIDTVIKCYGKIEYCSEVASGAMLDPEIYKTVANRRLSKRLVNTCGGYISIYLPE